MATDWFFRVCLLTEMVSSQFSKKKHGRPIQCDSVQTKGSRERSASPILCNIRLELNPFILPGNSFKGLFQYTWQMRRHTLMYSITELARMWVKEVKM